MISKSGDRFSDKIMLKTKYLAREDQPDVACGTPSSNLRSRRRVCAGGRGRAGEGGISLLHRRRDARREAIVLSHCIIADRAAGARAQKSRLANY